MPRARLLTETCVSQAPSRDLGAIDIERIALVSSPLALKGGPRGACRVVEDKPGRLVVACGGTTPQLLVVTESYHEGWTAMAGGSPVQVLPVYGDLLGCLVPPGQHAVVLDFSPASLRWGFRLTLAGCILVVVMVSVLWFLKGSSRTSS